MMIRRSAQATDRGSATIEMAILTLGVLMLIAVATGIGRVQHARQAVEAAARDAARQASLARDPGHAHRQATASATAALEREQLRCQPRLTLDATGLNRRVGTQASVSARVTCALPVGDLLVPGLPGSLALTATATSPIDPHRGE